MCRVLIFVSDFRIAKLEMSLDKFVSACGAGDLAAAQAEYEQNPAVLNQRDRHRPATVTDSAL